MRRRVNNRQSFKRRNLRAALSGCERLEDRTLLSTAELTMNLVELDSQPGLEVGEQFDVDVQFTKVAGDGSTQAAFSGYADVGFDPALLRADSLTHDADYPFGRTGTIDNITGVVNEVGAVGNVTPADDGRVFTVRFTVLSAGTTLVSSDAGKDPVSQIVTYGDGNDQRENTDFGSLGLLLGTAPGVSTIERQTPATSPTNADQVTFRIAFTEDVQNVTAADFALSGTAGSGGLTGNPTVVTGASVFDITITGLTDSNGTVNLDIASGNDIQDLLGNLLGPSPIIGREAEYTIDNQLPTVTSFTRHDPQSSPTNADALIFRATFDEFVTNVDISGFVVDGVTSATVSSVTLVTASTYDVTVSGGDLAGLNGPVGLNLSGSQDITDLAGNSVVTAEPATDETYDVVNDAPGPSNVTVTQDNRITIRGDRGDNRIRVKRAGRGLLRISGLSGTLVNGNGEPLVIAVGDERLIIQTAAGNDLVLLGTLKRTITINTGRGDDQVRVRSVRGQEIVTINLASGDDLIKAFDAVFTGEVNWRGGSGNDSIIVTNSQFQNAASVATHSGDDQIIIDDSLFRGAVLANTGSGNDTVEVERHGDQDGAKTEFQASLRLQTSRGADVVRGGLPNSPGNSVVARNKDVLIHGGSRSDVDILDAGILTDPNAHGNSFLRNIRLLDFETLLS